MKIIYPTPFTTSTFKNSLLKTTLKTLCLYAALLFSGLLPALQAKEYRISIDSEPKKILRGHLELGGKNPAGDEINANSYFIERNGKPFIPVVGELHYSRYPSERWEEAILKMKAGGINIVSSYVFWNIHERKEGKFDWQGRQNLRRFIKLIEKHHLQAIVRIGPFCHGEIRNGGLPDWLYGRSFEVRSNDKAYLKYVDRLYSEIGQQLKGTLYADGGPVIGIQLENEYQHSAAPWELTYPGAKRENTVADRDRSVTHLGVSESHIRNTYAKEGREHMATLKKLAIKHGMKAPLFTATGWGNAAIAKLGSLPVTAGYAYPFWSKPKPSPFYLYKDLHLQPDYSPVSFNPELYPSLSAEMGVGIVATWKRRPLVKPESAAPMIIRTLGSGANGIGYYMYHGGSTPVFEHFYSEEAGGAPKINYDFQAPLGEYGQVRPHHRTLNEVHMMLQAIGDSLAPMKTVLPKNAEALTATNVDDLRWAVRSNGDAAFVFMHNFQDHLKTKTIEDIRLTLSFDKEDIHIPAQGSFNLKAGTYAVFPVNLPLGPLNIKYATAQALRFYPQKQQYLFTAREGIAPEFLLNSGAVTTEHPEVKIENRGNITLVRGPKNTVFSFTANAQTVVVIPQHMVRQAWEAPEGQLIFSAATVLNRNGKVDFLVKEGINRHIHVFPASNTKALRGTGKQKITQIDAIHPAFNSYQFNIPQQDIKLEVKKISHRKLQVQLRGNTSKVNDAILSIPYVGDRGLAFIDGELIADHFYYGRPWEIALTRFAALKNKPLLLVFHPMYEDYSYLEDLAYEGLVPDFTQQSPYLSIEEPTLELQFKITGEFR